jgi:hypothetical protein
MSGTTGVPPPLFPFTPERILGGLARTQRIYEVPEANEVLPRVRRLVSRIAALSVQLPELQDELRIAEYRMRRPSASAQETDRYDQSMEAHRAAEEDLAAAALALDEMGVLLKHPVEGLVDFYSYRDGELVELCWKLGEDRVAHWHHIGEGFPGRKPL